MAHPPIRPLPQNLEALADIALDLGWTWSHVADRLWQTLSPEMWERTRNPWLILQGVSSRRLAQLAADEGFLGLLDSTLQARIEYRARPAWYAQAGHPGDALVAYFSMEYGLSDALPLYSGGLGMLAGDLLKTASDLGVPLVALGLLYQVGYFRQMIDADGQQLEIYPYSPPRSLPIMPLRDADGAWLGVPLDLPGRTVVLRVWHAEIGRVSLYLLDSNDPINSPFDRGITSSLYHGGPETRLVQELALGVGGWRLIETLGLPVDICHLNEGHAAMATIERARSFAQAHRIGFSEALWATRAGNVFTTHTAVPAAFDHYPAALATRYMRPCAQRLGIDCEELLRLGRLDPDDRDGAFSLPYLAARTSSSINGVSRLHGEVSRRIFQPLYPRWPPDEVPVMHVTNGVHAPTWDSAAADAVWTEACGKERWLGTVEWHPELLRDLDDETFWNFRNRQRLPLVQYARRRLARQLGQRGAEAAAVDRAMKVLDPDVLTLGFARRFAEYKRPALLLADPERFARLLTDPQRPVQIIVAGKAHPDDREGKAFVRAWAHFVSRPEMRSRAVFLEDYDMSMALELVQGVDLWINTPRRPWEASGTSGMKVLVNGGLNLSELDGWWAEGYEPERGWALGDGLEHEPDRDAVEAAELYRLLESHVVPLFYDRDASGIPRGWVARMRESMAELAPRFSSNRMLREYVDQIYRPSIDAYRTRAAADAALASAMHAWSERVRRHWGRVHIGPTEVREEGGRLQVAVPVHLGVLSPTDVRVELYARETPAVPCVRAPLDPAHAPPGAAQTFLYRGVVSADRPIGHYTARVMPAHPGVRVPAELPLIVWQK